MPGQDRVARKLLERARALFDEYKTSLHRPYWVGSAEYDRLLERVQRLAKEIDVNATPPDYEATAMMLLEYIATKEDVEISFKDEVAGSAERVSDPNPKRKPRHRRRRVTRLRHQSTFSEEDL